MEEQFDDSRRAAGNSHSGAKQSFAPAFPAREISFRETAHARLIFNLLVFIPKGERLGSEEPTHQTVQARLPCHALKQVRAISDLRKRKYTKPDRCTGRV